MAANISLPQVRQLCPEEPRGKGLWQEQGERAEQVPRSISSDAAAVSGNSAPYFNMTLVYVPEDLELGEEAFQLTAIDVDGDPLTYSISGSDAYYFSVDGKTGKVTLKNSLDREFLPRLTITIEVSDGINQAGAPGGWGGCILIPAWPMALGSPWSPAGPEYPEAGLEGTKPGTTTPALLDDATTTPLCAQNMEINSVIYTVFANDSDTGSASKVSYSIEEVIPDSTKNLWLFYILANGNVVLNGSLDYTTNTFYQLKILAKDGGGMLHNVLTFQQSSTYLSLTIRDLPNLDPRFLNEPYSGSVPENCALGTTVLTVTAMDRDTGVNDEIFYNITTASIPFAIDATTGTITVSGPLDREQLPSEEVLLEVTAREKELNIYNEVAQVSTLVTVVVTDINDNKPEFYNCSLASCNFSTSAQNNFRGNIIEHSSSRLPVSDLSIVTYDPDKGTNSSYELYLQGPDASAFTVSPTKIVGTGEVQLLVQDPLSVDYEKSHVMVVQIIANDTGNPTDCCSTATVTIDLIDSNDHIPEFPQSTYNLSVMENSPDGTIIATNITAYDPDSGVLGEITYQLLPESIRKTFAVNATTGAVLVQDGSLLDRETRSIYYANLQAKDGGNLVSTTVLEITLLDDNDMTPIVTGSYFISVQEGQNVTTQIQAIDNDEPGNPNSELGFKILPGSFSNNFTIDVTTGEMHSKEPLDREALEDERGQMVVTVEVYDHGVPQLSTSVNVTITVGDMNDNTPMFLNQSYEFSVFEDSPGSFVGDVEATDADRTEINSRISFTLQRGSGSSNFLIRSSQLGSGYYSGQLSVDPDISLDYDTLQEKFFSLVVLAENTAAENVGDIANVSVVVHILDVNDEPPTILPSSLQDVPVSENGTQHGVVHTVVASDADTNHSLVFEELAVACFKDTSSAGEVCWDWFVLAPNGSVLVTSSDIDYELCDTVVLTLRAEDLYTEKGSRYSQNGPPPSTTTGHETLRILITDVNDNAPVFLPISETFGEQPGLACPVGSSLHPPMLCHAARRGCPRNLCCGPASGYREGEELGVASSLDSSLKGQYQVTVEAQDSEAPVHTAQTTLNIFAVDQSYRIRLQFVTTVEEVRSNSEKIKALIQSNPLILAELVNLGLAIIGPGVVATTSRDTELIGIIAGLAAFLVIFILIMTLVLVLTTRRVASSLDSSLKGQYQVTVEAQDSEAPVHTAQTTLNIFAVDQSYRIRLQFVTTVEEVRSNSEKIKAALTTVTKAGVYVVAIQETEDTRTSQVEVKSVMEVYFVYSNGTALDVNQLSMANPILNVSLDPSHDLGFHDDSSSVASMNSLDENTVNAPGDDSLKAKQGKAQLMDTTDEEALVAALNLKMPTKTVHINTTFTTTDL
nr:PREDICTED: cadherin-related family member 2 [Opisthocomus hoazin]